MKRVLLAHRHEVVLAGLAAWIAASGEFELAAQIEDPACVAEYVHTLGPKLLVLDSSMAELSGGEAMNRVRDLASVSCVVGIGNPEDRLARTLFQTAGAAGFVSDRATKEQFLYVLKCVAAGRLYFNESIPVKISRVQQWKACNLNPMPGLSQRESVVVRHLARGYTNKEIANLLAVSVKSVETYKSRAMAKLNARSRCDIVTYALQEGWLSGRA